MTVRIGNGAGFLGDSVAAPRRLVEATSLDYLTLEYLAELTMSILARQREKNPALGYASDFLEVLQSLLPALMKQPQLKIVTNAGGVNPLACANVAAKLLVGAGMGEARIGLVTGDDLLPRLGELQQNGCKLENLDTGEPLSALHASIVSANAYLGAQPISEAFGQKSRIVITGRVADASLTLGPVMYEFNWKWDDWQRLAQATVAGHLIECGAQATGGLAPKWRTSDLAHVGYPYVEIEPSAEFVITRPSVQGGEVSIATVSEQLVYEIGDPAHYLTPDVDVDFTGISLKEVGRDRIHVCGARGNPAPEMLKVSLAYRDGYMASGQLLVSGVGAAAKAKACGEMILTRVRDAGFSVAESLIEVLGTGIGVPGRELPVEQIAGLREVVLRVTARDAQRVGVERFTKEFAPLITSGPAGLAGYASGRPEVRSVFAYWPTLVPRDLIAPQVEVRAAKDFV
jgi:hypothetical protein